MFFPSRQSCPSHRSCHFYCLSLPACDGRSQATLATQTSPDWFSDRAEQSSLTFTHVNGMSGKFYYAEIIGSGVALFDAYNDGDLDVYLAQGQSLEPGAPPAVGAG